MKKQDKRAVCNQYLTRCFKANKCVNCKNADKRGENVKCRLNRNMVDEEAKSECFRCTAEGIYCEKGEKNL